MSFKYKKTLVATVLIAVAIFFIKKQKIDSPVSSEMIAPIKIEPLGNLPIKEKPEEISKKEDLIRDKGIPTNPAVVSKDNLQLDKEIKKLRNMAKTTLASVYTAQKAFFSEHNRYSSDLMMVGWEPGQPEINYKVGYLYVLIPGASQPLEKEDPYRISTDSFIGLDDPNQRARYYYPTAVEMIDLSSYESLCKNKCAANAEGFETLIAVLLPDGGIDVWTMNDKKEITLVQDGQAKNQ